MNDVVDTLDCHSQLLRGLRAKVNIHNPLR